MPFPSLFLTFFTLLHESLGVEALRHKRCGNRCNAYPAPALFVIFNKLADDERREYARHSYPVAGRTRADRRVRVGKLHALLPVWWRSIISFRLYCMWFHSRISYGAVRVRSRRESQALGRNGMVFRVHLHPKPIAPKHLRGDQRRTRACEWVFCGAARYVALAPRRSRRS